MGSVSSPNQKVEALYFLPFPTKPIKGEIVRVGHSMLVMKGDNGSLYTTAVPLNKKAHCVGSWEWSTDLVKALDQLGLMTPEMRAEHQAYLNHCEKRSELVSLLGELTRASKNPLSGVTKARLIKVWNALDARGQAEAERYNYRPEGAVRKGTP